MNPKPSSTFKWVAKACAKPTDPRPILHYVYSDGARIMAADGHRMHAANADGLKAGYYTKHGEPVDLDRPNPMGEYFAENAPTKNETPTWTWTRATLPPGQTVGKYSAVRIADEEGLQHEYLATAIGGMGEARVYKGPGRWYPVYITNGERSALIMPLRM